MLLLANFRNLFLLYFCLCFKWLMHFQFFHVTVHFLNHRLTEVYLYTAYMTAVCFIVLKHTTANNGSSGGNSTGSGGVNGGHIDNAVTARYCTLGLLDQCGTNEQCVVRRKSTVLRSRSGLCRCMPGFSRHPQTGLCVNGRK